MQLSQAPLVQVVAQMHFSELPPYAEAALQQLHRVLIDAGFPERVAARLEAVEWALPGHGNEEPRQRRRQIERLLFKGPGQRRLVELRQDRLLFKVTDYTGHETFLRDWDQLIALVADALPEVGKALLHRVSLRYVDLIVPKDHESLSELVSPTLMPPPLSEVDGASLFGSTLKVVDTGEGRHLRVAFEEIQPQQARLTKVLPDDLIEHASECGLSINAYPHWQEIASAYGLLDIDHVYVAAETPVVAESGQAAIFRGLYEQTHRAFWGLITEQARSSWA